MTREEAANILDEVKVLDDSMYQYNPAYLQALDVAIEALKIVPNKIQKLMCITGETEDALLLLLKLGAETACEYACMEDNAVQETRAVRFMHTIDELRKGVNK